jgi:hypothetical protein
MDYFHWVGGTVLLLYGISLVGLRIYVLFMIMLVPATLLIMHMLSGWIAVVAVFAAMAVMRRVLRGPLRRRERERAAAP